MKKYTIFIPLCATATHEIEAEDLEEAIEIAKNLIENKQIDYNGYEPDGSWWIDEE